MRFNSPFIDYTPTFLRRSDGSIEELPAAAKALGVFEPAETRDQVTIFPTHA
jgi:hypothetical protein